MLFSPPSPSWTVDVCRSKNRGGSGYICPDYDGGRNCVGITRVDVIDGEDSEGGSLSGL